MKIFKEQQRFSQWWIYIIIAASLLFMVIPVLVNSNDISNDIAAKTSLIISILLIAGAVILIRMMTLHTRIDDKGIHYRFTPFQGKKYLIVWNDISNVYVRKYNAITEYGGWGFRGYIFKSGGKAFNVMGNRGIQIVLKNGKKMLIGTQKEVEAERILDVYKSKIIKPTA
ncbi:hypothetical protein [Aureibaculum luteum]|uniref:hypothetical protein n=1 Tax=Aureibaculum luteum TaxID=1548456 RepID=UPI000E50956D|nr:hypothetical protein [Aureibaculum luteum]